MCSFRRLARPRATIGVEQPGRTFFDGSSAQAAAALIDQSQLSDEDFQPAGRGHRQGEEGRALMLDLALARPRILGLPGCSPRYAAQSDPRRPVTWSGTPPCRFARSPAPRAVDPDIRGGVPAAGSSAL